jgi:hypothetical protein
MMEDELRDMDNDVAVVPYREYDLEIVADSIDEGNYERATAQALLAIARSLQNINAALRMAQ